MKEKIQIAGLYSALNMLRNRTHHAFYNAGEDAFTFRMESHECNFVELEYHQYIAIIDLLTYMAQHIHSTPEGRLDPSKVLFKYKVENG